MRYVDQFKRFDPLNGIVPPNLFFYHLNDIAARARKILRGRTSDELHWAGQSIDWMIDCYIEKLADEAKLESTEPVLRHYFNDVYWFLECSSNYIYSGIRKFKDAKRFEFFAVLALWQVIEALEYCGKIAFQFSSHSINNQMAGCSAIQAMEAICNAEMLSRIEYWDAKVDDVAKKTEEVIAEKAFLKKSEAAIKGKANLYAHGSGTLSQ